MEIDDWRICWSYFAAVHQAVWATDPYLSKADAVKKGHFIIESQIKKASNYHGLITNLVMECHYKLALEWIRNKTLDCSGKFFKKVESSKKAI